MSGFFSIKDSLKLNDILKKFLVWYYKNMNYIWNGFKLLVVYLIKIWLIIRMIWKIIIFWYWEIKNVWKFDF